MQFPQHWKLTCLLHVVQIAFYWNDGKQLFERLLSKLLWRFRWKGVMEVMLTACSPSSWAHRHGCNLLSEAHTKKFSHWWAIQKQNKSQLFFPVMGMISSTVPSAEVSFFMTVQYLFTFTKSELSYQLKKLMWHELCQRSKSAVPWIQQSLNYT